MAREMKNGGLDRGGPGDPRPVAWGLDRGGVGDLSWSAWGLTAAEQETSGWQTRAGQKGGAI